jgi:hypothetical protein
VLSGCCFAAFYSGRGLRPLPADLVVLSPIVRFILYEPLT